MAPSPHHGPFDPPTWTPIETPPAIADAWARAGARLGAFAQRLHCYGTVTSTNDLAMRLAAAGAAEGTTLVAEAQTAGRGRRGREWFSPAGAGLYLSVILRPAASSVSSPAEVTQRLTLAAGVATVEGVRTSSGLQVELKWPNDLVFERRKVAGILAEVSSPPGTGRDAHEAVILGVGVNVGASAYPPEVAATATSLERELGRPVDRALVLVETVSALASRYEDLRSGRVDAILSAWRRYAPALPGSAIEWDGPDGPQYGHAIDIAEDGALMARQGDDVTRLVAGEVRWRSR